MPLGVSYSVDCNQGQDEVPRGAVVTDYSDSVLVPSAVVNHTNEEIRKLGGEKVRVYVFLLSRQTRKKQKKWDISSDTSSVSE